MAKLDGKDKQAVLREREGAKERGEEGWQINNSLRRKTAGVKFELQDFVSKDI